MMQQLFQLLTRLEDHISHYGKIDSNVSSANVGWHLQHACLVIIKVSQAVKQSDPAAFSPHFNLAKALVFTIRKIPRGKGKAPESVLTITDITPQSLQSSIEQAKYNLQDLQSLSPKHFFKHPYFGHLNLEQTVKFLGIHTKHHLKIVEEIVGNAH